MIANKVSGLEIESPLFGNFQGDSKTQFLDDCQGL